MTENTLTTVNPLTSGMSLTGSPALTSPASRNETNTTMILLLSIGSPVGMLAFVLLAIVLVRRYNATKTATIKHIKEAGEESSLLEAGFQKSFYALADITSYEKANELMINIRQARVMTPEQKNTLLSHIERAITHADTSAKEVTFLISNLINAAEEILAEDRFDVLSRSHMISLLMEFSDNEEIVESDHFNAAQRMAIFKLIYDFRTTHAASNFSGKVFLQAAKCCIKQDKLVVCDNKATQLIFDRALSSAVSEPISGDLVLTQNRREALFERLRKASVFYTLNLLAQPVGTVNQVEAAPAVAGLYI